MSLRVPRFALALTARNVLVFAGAITWLISLNAAWGVEFRSVAVNGAILYDAPSFKATRVYLISKHYPLEIISRSGEWTKVRDANGDLSWIAASNLSDKRTLMAYANVVDVRDSPNDNAAIVFRAEKNVVFELVEPPNSLWVKVKHRDGQTGYARLNQLWGL
jgi:SH3 domain protein